MVRARLSTACLVAAAVALVGGTVGCTVGSGTTPPSSRSSSEGTIPSGQPKPTSATHTSDQSVSASAAACSSTGTQVDLGAVAFDVAPRRLVRVTAGRYRLTASGFLHGGLLDPKVGQTAVVWGEAASMPTYAAGPATVSGGIGRAVVVEGAETWVDLPDGTLWFVNSYGARLAIAACPPASVVVVSA
ncbi:hypothetical protein GCM10022399_19310 [Terrabacter ginsenosidimutans]|uniref:Uncharacterized protein n=1 Tax=Terrabacter ginsenosidimutans TaxID=490575 RepID=A0ABP7DAM7_9MICO